MGSPPSQRDINDPERVKVSSGINVSVPPLFKQVVSIYIADDCLYHFSKGGREMENREWELYIPCCIVSSLGEIKKAEEGKPLY